MKLNVKQFNIKVLALLILFLGCNTGCNNWIDIEPENELIKQEFWKTKDDIMAVIAATYDALRGCTEKSLLFGEIRADHCGVTGGESSNFGRIMANDITPTNSACSWAEYYSAINLANTVMFFAPQIQELDKSLTDRELEGIEAEMLFIRSLCYFYLVRIWKDVPLVLDATVSDTVDFYLPKTDEREVLAQVVKDLEYASTIAFEAKYSSDRAMYKGRANKFAIQALLADISLWMEDYPTVVAYCDSLEATGRFMLETEETWFNLYYPGNSLVESIFEIQYDDAIEAQENSIYYSLVLVDRPGSSQLQADIDKIAYDEDTDIRYCEGQGPVWKYVGKDETGRNSSRRSTSERDGNFIYYRYADVILMKAEALGELGQFEEGNNLIREITDRAGTEEGTPAYTLREFRTKVLIERGREFAAEGKRWFDVLRFAKKEGFSDKKLLMDILLSKASDAQELAIMRTKVIDTMSYFLPIHEDEIKFNRELVQNPYYDR